ncbi:putative F-box protein At3g25750 [Mercurialis annua]|uniref:putative F-box protein At3g25750 n=1 Tax=Mercurialis annua TaxID=3986 RepID=UPI0024AFE19B|nr:putative F-box protein At3g25750 [Mercurialis annua]
MGTDKLCCWSDLPIDILASIIKLLEARIDIIRVGSVCQSWRNSIAYYRSSAKGNVISPLALPFHDSLQKYSSCRIKTPKFLNFYLTITYMVKPICQDSKSFLIEVDHHHLGQHKARLLHLVTRNNDTSFHRNGVVDSRNYHVSELCRNYTLRYIYDSSSNRKISIFKKVIIYPDNDRTRREDCVVFAINLSGNLIYSKFGDGDWKMISKNTDDFEDMIVYNGQVYAVDWWSHLWIIDCSSSDYFIKSVCESIREGPAKNNLVESCGDLYLIIVSVHKGIKVYKLRDCKYWDLVRNIDGRFFPVPKRITDDRIFFVPMGYNSSFSISAKDNLELNEMLYFFSLHTPE